MKINENSPNRLLKNYLCEGIFRHFCTENRSVAALHEDLSTEKREKLPTEIIFQQPVKICAIIVAYHTGESIAKVIAAISGQIQHLVIIDNSADEKTLGFLHDIKSQNTEFYTIINNKENNFAAAQNLGIEYAQKDNYDFVLLMDHDSTPAPNMVEILLNAWKNHINKENIGIIAPYLQDEHSKRTPRYPQLVGKTGWNKYIFHRVGLEKAPIQENLFSVISSGSLIPMHVFEKTGYMDESFNIDYVDIDFCLRVVLQNLQIIAVRDAVLHHKLGLCEDHNMLGLCVTTTNHNSNRLYTISRNRIVTWKRYGRKIPAYLLHDMAAMAYDFVKIIFIEQNKLAKLRSALHGICVGIMR